MRRRLFRPFATCSRRSGETLRGSTDKPSSAVFSSLPWPGLLLLAASLLEYFKTASFGCSFSSEEGRRAHWSDMATLLPLRGVELTVSDTSTPLFLVRAAPVLPLSSASDLLAWLLALL